MLVDYRQSDRGWRMLQRFSDRSSESHGTRSTPLGCDSPSRLPLPVDNDFESAAGSWFVHRQPQLPSGATKLQIRLHEACPIPYLQLSWFAGRGSIPKAL